MNIAKALLICLGVLLAIILALAVLPPIPYATGYPHPEIEGLLISKATIDDRADTRLLGFAYGFFIILLMGLMLYTGSLRNGKPTKMARHISVGIAAYLLVYCGMVFEHWRYGKGNEDFFYWLPKPTAWMIIGMWFVPLMITFTFYFKFEKYVLSRNEEAKIINELAALSAEETAE